MATIQYPRNRRASFVRLGIFFISFAASFWWTVQLAKIIQHYSGWSWETCAKIGMGFWLAHIMAGFVYFVNFTVNFKKATDADYRRIYRLQKITSGDAIWINKNIPPEDVTIHRSEGLWLKGESHRRPPDHFVEFHNDEARVLFKIARSAK